MLAVASGLVMVTASVAAAARIRNVAQLRQSCGKSSSGQFSVSADGQSAICDLAGGKTIVCLNRKKGQKCSVVKTIKFELEPDDSVNVPGGSLTTPDISKSRVFRRTVAFEDLDVVCAGLDGAYLASIDLAYGTCGLPTATIICASGLSGKNCTGMANTKKEKRRVAEQVDVALRVLFLTAERTPAPQSGGSSSGSSSTTSPPTSTTTSSTTTTTISD